MPVDIHSSIDCNTSAAELSMSVHVLYTRMCLLFLFCITECSSSTGSYSRSDCIPFQFHCIVLYNPLSLTFRPIHMCVSACIMMYRCVLSETSHTCMLLCSAFSIVMGTNVAAVNNSYIRAQFLCRTCSWMTGPCCCYDHKLICIVILVLVRSSILLCVAMNIRSIRTSTSRNR